MPSDPTIVPSRRQRQAAPPPPCTMVLFGANGDLTNRLVFPALYNLSHTHLLPADFCLIGADLADGSTESWIATLTKSLNSFVGGSGEFEVSSIDEAALKWLTDRMMYIQGDITKPELYTVIDEKLKEAKEKYHTGDSAMFYLAVADRFFGTVVEHLGNAGLTKSEAPKPAQQPAFWRRVVIEKPFGHDLQSAKDLNARVGNILREDQIFRMDHFLGKETVQNIMALRFANGMFEPLWNRDRIDHVQITVAETVGVEGRGKFYEVTGAMRDMVPNHVFQLLAMVAMEPPNDFGADSIRSRKADVLDATRRPAADDAVRGQYNAGTVLGHPAAAYRNEPNVAADSVVETYVAMRLFVENWRWAGVPFYLRTGKYMSRRSTEIAIKFKSAPHALFEDTATASLGPNWLVIQIQPDEGISMQFEVKRPGPLMELAPVLMDFKYKDWFPAEPNVGYETLLYDVMIGDATLFQRADQVEAGWAVVQPILDAWAAAKPVDFPNYDAGSDGPRAADDLIGRDGNRKWRPVVGH